MKVEKRIKLYELDTEVWLSENAEILGLVLDGKLFQLVVWEDTMAETLHKRKFVYAVMNDILRDAEKTIYVGTIFDPELDEDVYVFEVK